MSVKKLHTFSVNYFSEMEDKEFSGTFTCQKQSILDHSRIQRRKSELCGGMYCVRDDKGSPTGQGIDEETEMYNYAISVLETVLIQKPAWWNLEEVNDFGLMMKVFEEVMSFENSFRGRGRNKDRGEESSGSSQEASEEESQEAHAAHNAPKMVDRQVQAALD